MAINGWQKAKGKKQNGIIETIKMEI